MTEQFSRADVHIETDAFRARHMSAQMRPHSTWRANLGGMGTNVARIMQAPPGYYEHPPYDGVSLYMALSRGVGKMDVGEGLFDISVQAGDFVVGVPGAGGQMDSYRGGHGMQIVLSPEALRVAAETRKAPIWDFRRLHTAFHRDRTILNLAKDLVRDGLSTRRPDPLHVDTLVLTLLEALAQFSETCDRRQREAAALDADTVAKVADFMEAHLSEEVTLEALADVAGMPRTRFIKAFRNAVGETPYQHLLRKRLEAARVSIMASSSSLAETAFACGFSSQQHLTGHFSSRFGITPSAFRKQVLNREIVERQSLALDAERKTTDTPIWDKDLVRGAGTGAQAPDTGARG